MQTSDFHFELPPELIAQTPSGERGKDRLLRLDRRTGAWSDHDFSGIADLVDPGTLMVFNNSRVRHARLYGIADSSGNRAEFLLISRVDSPDCENGSLWKAMARNAKRHKPGRTYSFDDGLKGEIVADADGSLAGTEFRLVRFNRVVEDSWLDKFGHLPLPPYITREDGIEDADRYQTVYSRTVGSVAAPTAGLHFTPEVLASLDARGIERAEVTLHVGLGTFLPVRTETIEDHVMHEERYEIPESTAQAVNRAKAEGRPVLAVGTTSVRTLESAYDADKGFLPAGEGSTGIFIYPGYEFKAVDQLFTNFHTPGSTLLMLVSAFAGRERILAAYDHAIEERYRFFSYGDSMLIR